jgi:hypothetical protein
MSERPAEEIRLEIAAERQGLATDLDGLHKELRSLLPVVAGIALALFLFLKRKKLRRIVKLLWWFR